MKEKAVQNRQVRVWKLNESEPSDEVSKQVLPVKTIRILRRLGHSCSGYLITGCRAGGIEAAGATHRLVCGTGEAPATVC